MNLQLFVFLGGFLLLAPNLFGLSEREVLHILGREVLRPSESDSVKSALLFAAPLQTGVVESRSEE
ncbi:MAG: hypothetical protein AAF514_16280, partial [Verrucomicrobiota bacterium]